MRLVIVMVHVFFEAGRAHLHGLSFAVVLCQVADHQALRCIPVDINEVGQDTVGSEYDQSNDEPVRVA